MALPSESSPLLPPPPEPPVERCGSWADVLDAKASSASRPSSSSTLTQSSLSRLDLADSLRDVIIGFSDGLTVPFALTAGLSSLGSARLVIIGGLAELFSGMISMGLGAYLAALTERDHYHSQRRLLSRLPPDPAADIYAILDRYHLSRAAARPVVDELCRDRHQWIRFKLDLGLGLTEPHGHRPLLSGLTMGLSYFVGGLIPMLPYFFATRVRDALFASVGLTVLILLAFGYAKDYATVRNHRAGFRGALQTLAIGILAAGTSYAMVKALDARSP